METTTQQPFAVVTGASHGIGYELARELFRRGYSLLICAEDEAINDAAQRIGNSVQALQVDLSSFEGVEQLCTALKRSNRPVDVAAINAGVGNGGAPFVESSLEADLAVINLNVTSAVHLAKRVAVDMVARGSGRILLTSSIASATPGPYNAVYHASKAFIQSFAEAIRNELEDTGVTVTALMPGATETNFFTRANMVETTVGQSAKDDPVEVAQQGIEALLAGKDHVVAGSFKNKVETVLAKVLPDTVNAQMGRKQNQPVR